MHREKVKGTAQWSAIGQASLGHQIQVVKVAEYFTGRLMNSANNRSALGSQELHALHNRHGHERIQATSRLIAEQDPRVGYYLGGER